MIAPVVAMTVFMGLAPTVFLHPTAASLERASARMAVSRHVNAERMARPDGSAAGHAPRTAAER